MLTAHFCRNAIFVGSIVYVRVRTHARVHAQAHIHTPYTYMILTPKNYEAKKVNGANW